MIYLDNNATTKVLPEVFEAMRPFYTELWGNPSSLHPFGAQVAKHIDKAREQVTALISAQRESEIIFTSGGTESNNLAIRGALFANPGKKHIVTTPVEHPSVLSLCQQLEKEGYEVDYRLDHPEAAIREETALVSVMWANNETGVIFPIEKVAAICQNKNVPFHVDATQAAGKISIDLRHIPVSLLSISGHKLHAPKGIGALYVRRGTKISPLFFGGHQERGRRAGTENVAGLVGLGKACELAQGRLKNGAMEKIAQPRDRFEKNLAQKFPSIRVNGKASPRLPNTSSISFEGLEGEAICLLLGEEDICVSTGSACSAGSLEPSHVLKAMGLNVKQARGTVRFSMSFETTPEEIETTEKKLEKIIRRLWKTS